MKNPARMFPLLLAALSAVLVAPRPAQAHEGHGHQPMAYTQGPGDAPDAEPVRDADGRTWWKGNLHTHTLWSDGDQYPELVVDWYKRHGYHFLGLSDHNILSEGEKWVGNASAERNLDAYAQRFGEGWVQTREDDASRRQVRLKPLDEFRTLFEEPGRFLMIQSEEITGQVHVIATNLREVIMPPRGGSVEDLITRSLASVYEQRERTGVPMFPHLAHPNYVFAVTAEDMAPVEQLRFFEVYNGHRGVRNRGDDKQAGLDRVWDIVLTRRLGELGLGLVYALAVDDAHHYADSTSDVARPGRGWVVVRADYLTPEHLIDAMERGNFYASTGVTLKNVGSADGTLSVEVLPEDGVTYTIRFIGTRRGYDPASEPVRDADGQPMNLTRRYSDDIGRVLKEVHGTTASYTCTGEELYVRAHIVSSKIKDNPFVEGETEQAWAQPMLGPGATPAP